MPAVAERAPAQPGDWRVLGTALALLGLIGLTLAVVLGLFARPVDGALLQRQFFGEEPAPFGLERIEATRLASRDVLVRFARPEGVEPGPGEPGEVIFQECASRSTLDALFRPTQLDGGMGGMGGMGGSDLGMKLKEWEQGHGFAWHGTMKRDEIVWGAWRSKLLIERAFLEGGGWREQARVDLSQGGRWLALLAEWPPETPVDEGRLKELLRAVKLAPPATAGS